MTTSAKPFPVINRQFRLAARPVGMPNESDFTLTQTTLPVLGDGQVLAKTILLSVDPYIRLVISGDGAYAAPITVGSLIPGLAIGAVVASHNSAYAAGDYVLGDWGWQEHSTLCT